MDGVNRVKFIFSVLFLLNIVFANDFKLTQVAHIPLEIYTENDIKQAITNEAGIVNPAGAIDETEENKIKVDIDKINSVKNYINSLKSNHKKIYINLPDNFSKNYYLIWNGSIIQVDDDIYCADGNGTIQLLRKSDEYVSTKLNINIIEGHIQNDLKLKSSNFYKCLDNECYEKEYKAQLIYKQIQEDENQTKTTIKEDYIYRGTLKINNNVTIDGIGTLETNSSTYSGEFKDSNITGYGTFKTKTNNKLGLEIEQQGLWSNGYFIDGYLSTVYQDGGIYKGQSKHGKPDGKGTFIWPDKSKYTGSFQNGKKNGFGTYTFKDGSIYSGNYSNDKKDGYGELYIKSKDIYYKGEFKDGNFQGSGELYIQNKATYIGKFKNNLPHGKGVLIDDKDNITKVFAVNGVFNPYMKTSFLQNFPFPQAHAGWLSDKFNNIVNTVTTAVNDASKWVSDNSEHLVNAAKGCIAGSVGGAATGTVTGAVIGTAVGAIGGALAGGLNGCMNQAQKAFDISKANGGEYTWEDAQQALVDEISVENAVVGALGGLSSAAVLAKQGVVTAKTYQFMAITTRIVTKTPAIQASIKFLSKQGLKLKKSICKIGYMKNSSFCKLSKNNDDKVSIPSIINIASWNLKNLSANSANRDWKTIKNYIQSKKNYDFIALQEIMNESALNKIKGSFLSQLSKSKGLIGKKEYYGFLINKKYMNRTKLVEFRQYKSFIRPPSVLLVDKKFALINVHIVYGKESTMGKSQRIKEVLALNQIVKTIKKKHNINNIIIAGDFNIDFEENIYKALSMKLLSQGLIQYINEPTTIGNLAQNRFNKKYDHFITNGISTNSSVDRDILTNRKQSYFNKKVSDHLPISGTFIFYENDKKKNK